MAETMKLLPAVILEASKQSYKVQRLVHYCRELDGTELKVIKLPQEIDVVPHPIGTELAMRYASDLFDEPWLYLEADSIPLKPGWLAKITEEYYSAGKPFLLPSMEGCSKYDIASAIGVYPVNSRKYYREDHTTPPWFDRFLFVNHAPDIHFSKQIMHRYGHYNGYNVEKRYEFPRDKKELTEEAVIFHADPTQSIIRGGLMQSYFHSGDLGDIIAALPIIRQQGGGQLVLGPHYTHREGRNPRSVMNSYQFGSIHPLLEIQTYIKRVEYKKWPDAHTDFDLSTFRFLDREPNENLAEWQGRHMGRWQLNMNRWLEVPDATWTGRIAVSRSLRYHNHLFPWKQIAERFRDRIIFIGLSQEHEAWQKLVGINVELSRTADLLDMAMVLAGCERHFGNQSLPSWITMGLGKTMIMEVWSDEPNSIVKNCSLSIFASTRKDMKEILCTF